ncbi:DNA polymerase III subunit beta [Candidatus Parcubacteria bacterium]|nr:MAG: DNA polymerase III subunit beta [Candidatus Parcubacteria bacterium]
MKLTCKKDYLKEAFSTAEKMLGKTLSLPILSNFLLSTDNGRLKISATDLEIGLNYWINSKIEKEGAIAVPGKLISSLINNLPDKPISFNSEKNKLIVSCDKYKTTLQGFDPAEYPIIPKVKSEKTITFDATELKEAISQVINAASLSDGRVELNGIFLAMDKNTARVVATDSFRLAEKKLKPKNVTGLTETSFIIPLKTANELMRMLDVGPTIEMHHTKQQALFRTENAELFSRLVEGNFPNYEQIIPRAYITNTQILRDDLFNALRVAGIFSSRINDVRFDIDPSMKEIFLTSTDQDKGENNVGLEARTEGKKMTVVFNHRYLLDGLSNIKTEKVILELSGETSAALLRPDGDGSYLYLVMPIKNY